MDTLNELVTGLAASPWIYLTVFLVCVIDGFFPPVPSEAIVIATATLAGSTGSPNIALLVAAASTGASTGDALAYTIGRRVGRTRFRWMRTARVTAAFDWAERGLNQRSALLLFTARYIPVGRIAVNMTAGAAAFPLRRFTLLTLAAGLSWAAYNTAIGVVAGKWLHNQQLLAIVIAIALATATGYLIDRISTTITNRRHRTHR